ncbi:MaoC family dehydratase [Crossiella equi]|uniref:MaoC family dehydratase n=1 Tax=Crossiella equi TaxID=130796 RepID=UPI000A3BECF3|nr:MaoC/PaaZ C-terminal domain-containing protein [Crossiella equi]
MDIQELDRPPGLGLLFPKAVLTGFTRGGKELPGTGYLRRGVTVEPEQLAAYNRVCGFGLTDALPATYPHILGFPMAVKLMTAPGFPFPLVGLVHIHNRITQLRPVGAHEPLELRVWAEHLAEHERGRQFDVVTEAAVDGEVVWREASTYLRRESGGGKDKKPEPPELPEPAAVWRVPQDIGRRYAKVSGDSNPIHLYPLTAKLFGFPRHIAHGMWTMARCLAAFEGRLPEAYELAVGFKLPVLLPGKVAFRTARTGGGWELDLRAAKDGRPHLAGTISG